MATEIERKFLVATEGWRERVEKTAAIRQYYLAVAADRSVRLRIIDNRDAKLTIKFGAAALVRQEFEYVIPLVDAEEMALHAVGSMIAKTRHYVREGNFLFEVDVFEGRLAGLVIAELEIVEGVEPARLPAWIGRQVTGDQRYSNAMLSLSEVAPHTIAALAG